MFVNRADLQLTIWHDKPSSFVSQEAEIMKIPCVMKKCKLLCGIKVTMRVGLIDTFLPKKRKKLLTLHEYFPSK